MSKFGVGERAPWEDFPPVIRNGDLHASKKEPEYQAAKAGNMPAAINLVERLLADDTVEKIRRRIRDSKPLLLPVLAVETSGNNKIPLAMARVLAKRLNLEVESDIVQSERVGRTGTNANHRLAFNPSFEGEVKTGQAYLIIDDTLLMGGTIASLRGYIENRDGRVIGASVMDAQEGAVDIAVKPKMLAAIENKHGPSMNQFWQETFGYGIDKLTQSEAGHLRRAASVDEIRDRLVKARHEGSERLGKEGIGSPLRSERGESTKRTEVSSALEQNYQETLGSYILAKYEQADRIEDRLEHLIERRQAHLQQRQLSQPGFLSLPATRKAWQAEQARQQAGLNRLRVRLKMVQKIKSGIRIEAFAASKMRKENPQLASDWDALREAERQHQARAKQQNRKPLEKSRGRSLSGPDR